MIIGSKAADTRVIWETRSPTWDQMIIFNDIVIWGDVNTIASNPPTIVTEIFDKDIGVRIFFTVKHFDDLLFSLFSLFWPISAQKNTLSFQYYKFS